MSMLLFGLVFGFILSRVGATDGDAILDMFLLDDLHIAGVIGVAVLVAGAGFRVLRARGYACESGCPRTLAPKSPKPGNVLGGVLFGTGWALTGTCPGTSLAQLGEGRWLALFTVVGIVLGAALHRVVTRRRVERSSRALERGGAAAGLREAT